jgi:hypothetical protein
MRFKCLHGALHEDLGVMVVSNISNKGCGVKATNHTSEFLYHRDVLKFKEARVQKGAQVPLIDFSEYAIFEQNDFLF